MTDGEYEFLSEGDTIINNGSITDALPPEMQIPNMVITILSIDGSFADLKFNDHIYKAIPRKIIMSCFTLGGCKKYDESLKWEKYNDGENWYFKTRLGYLKIFKNGNYWMASFNNIFINQSTDLEVLQTRALEWFANMTQKTSSEIRRVIDNINLQQNGK